MKNEQDTGDFNVHQFPVLLPPPRIASQERQPKGQEAPRAGRAELLPYQKTGEVIVFSVLALLGGGLFFLVALTDMLWVYPASFYGALVYVAWVRYFSQ